MVDVTIRGIDDEVYAGFSAEARRRDAPIGELVTLVMRAFLDQTRDLGEKIRGIPSIEVSAKDLKELQGQITFSEISRLEFNDDISWETFAEHVASLQSIGRLMVPSSFPRLPLLARCRNVGKIIRGEDHLK